MTAASYKSWQMRAAAGVAVVFGVLTILSGGMVLFGGDTAAAAAGNAVSFVLWFNFLSGFVYVLAGVGIAINQRWAAKAAIALAVAIAIVGALFALHVFRGGMYEMRTVGAMVLRFAIWVIIAVMAVRNAPAPRRLVG